MKVMVETSAHHVHVSDADLEALFGKGATLTNKKDLSQPGQFACEEKVEVVGPKGAMKMSILGPTRPETQVEISLTDARKLGVIAPDVVTVGFLIVLAAYSLISIRPAMEAYRHWKSLL